MKDYDVIGEVQDYCVLCEGCMDGTGEPIFAGSEWGYQPICDCCGEPLDVSLIPFDY